MGVVNPKFIDLECQQCSTRFRVRATKGRLPKGPVECPSCHASIPVVVPEPAASPEPTKQRPNQSSKITVEKRLDAITLSEESAPSTLSGIALHHDDSLFDDFPAPTANASDDVFPGDIDVMAPEVKKRTKKMFALEQPTESDHNNRTKAPWESSATRTFKPHTVHTALTHTEKTRPKVRALNMNMPAVEDVSSEIPAKPEAIAALPVVPTTADDSGEKPKLSDLLKQVREKRGTTVGLPPQAIAASHSPAAPVDKPTSRIPIPPSLSGLFHLPPSDKPTDQPAEKQTPKPPAPRLGVPPSKPEPDLRRTPFGKARAETVVRTLAAHGMAAEQTGSGFIRIPSAEILDLIGEGTYRLNVEGIIYEPIDEEGIRRLIVSGALGGDERIAKRGGEWLPLRDHRIFQRATAATHTPQATDAPAPLTEELDLSLDSIVEDISQTAIPAIPAVPSDTSGEMFPTAGFISVDQSREFQKAFSGEIRLPERSDLFEQPATAPEPIAPEAEHEDTQEPPASAEAVEPSPAQPETPAETPAQASEPPTPTRPRLLDPTEEVKPPLHKPKKAGTSKKVAGVLAAVALTGVLVGGFVLPGITSGNQSAEDVSKPVDAAMQPPSAASTAAQLEPEPQVVPVAEPQVAQVPEPEPVAEPQPTAEPEPVEPPAQPEARPANGEPVRLADFTVVNVDGAGIQITHEGRTGTLYPDTNEPRRAYRAILAVHALCQATSCGIAFAPAQKTLVPRQMLADLPNLAGSADHVEAVVVWQVPGAAQLPLQPLTTLWRKWMSLPADQHMLPVAEFKDDLVKAIGNERAEALLAQAQNINVGQLIRQISNVLVLDFLTNNFDRFDAKVDHWNLGLKDGVVYSLDESGAFQARASTRVKGRFGWTTRFDKTVFDGLRGLTADQLNDTLFPEPGRPEKIALKVFWKQHQAYVQRLEEAAQRDPKDGFF